MVASIEEITKAAIDLLRHQRSVLIRLHLELDPARGRPQVQESGRLTQLHVDEVWANPCVLGPVLNEMETYKS